MSDLKFVIVDVFMYWFLQIQQQELEAVRQREANLTALAAIGPRKKRRTDDGASVSALGCSVLLFYDRVFRYFNSFLSCFRPQTHLLLILHLM